jgi:hypothetical protein
MRRLSFIVVFIIAVSICTLMVVSQHSYPSSRCSLDGSQILPLYEVIIVQKDKSSGKFSCVISAQIWFRINNVLVSSIMVTDELTGEKIRAEHAYYVASEVITTPHTGNRIHVFAQRSKAELHARQFKGRLVKNPFQTQRKKTVLRARHRTNSPISPDLFFPSSQNPVFLSTRTALIKEQNYCYLSQKYPTRLSDGYLTPPYRPPKKIV